jgi:hypothetical protein
MEKFQPKSLNILLGHLLIAELPLDKFLPSNSLYGVSSLILFPLFAAGINNTGVNDRGLGEDSS